MPLDHIRSSARNPRVRLSQMSAPLAVFIFTCLCSASAHAQVSTISLREFLDGVYSKNASIKASDARTRGALGDLKSASAFTNPVFAYEVENARVPGRASPTMGRETMATIMFPLEPLYQRGTRVRHASANVRAQTSAHMATTQTVMLEAAGAFYSSSRARAKVSVIRELAVWLDSLVAFNNARFEQGATAEVDFIRSQVERDRALIELAREEAATARAAADFSALLYAAQPQLPASPQPDTLPLIAPQLPTSLSAAISIGLQSRADLQQSRESVVASEAAIGMERSLFVRDIGVMAGTMRTEGATGLIAGVSVPLPLFDRNTGQVRRATAERDAARFEQADKEREIRAQVSGAYEAAHLLTQQTIALSTGDRNYLARAEEARAISLGAYREGAVPLSQVIDAARSWSEARMSFFDLLYDQHQATLTLLFALGSDIRNALPARAGTGAPIPDNSNSREDSR